VARVRFGFVVNDVFTEEAIYTTIRLGLTATHRGHEAWFMGVGDLAYDPTGGTMARARRAPLDRYKSRDAYLRGVQGVRAVVDRISLDELDVLLLRNDPSQEKGHRSWAQTAGIDFGRLALRHGVVVLNDPNGLAKALNKMYLQLFPEEVRPRTLITRDRDEVKQFVQDEGGTCVLKPLQGSGGQNVFLVTPDVAANLNQMIDAVSRDGYVIAQEYLPKAEHGDTRLFLMNGLPLRHRGRYAAFRRVRTGGDLRSNRHVGGELEKAELDDNAFRLAEIVRPKLVGDGMFFVGLDIVGDRLMEINVFSPGGLGSAQRMEGVNFNNAVIDALERKASYSAYYRRQFDNVHMATL
jgi:glutathione synthase